MEKGALSFGYPYDTPSRDILGHFIEAFASRGWLNRNLRIRRQNARYRIFCSETEFMVFRINDNCCVSPGVPGWPVCMVNRECIVEDEHLSSGFAPTEPSAREWLASISDGSFELI